MVDPIAFPAPAAVDALARPAANPRRAAPAQPGGFARALDAAMQAPARPLRFSAHAIERMQQRGIALTPDDQARLASAVDAAAAKGARDAVFLMDPLALVVNVPSRTVVTLVPADEADHTVFTKIDSAVVVGRAAHETPSPGLDPLREAPRLLIDRSGRTQEDF